MLKKVGAVFVMLQTPKGPKHEKDISKIHVDFLLLLFF